LKYTLATLWLLTAVLAFAQGQPDNYRTASQNQPQESQTIPFTDFDAQVEVENAEFEVRGSFTLGATSDGINLFKEDVAFEVGTFSRIIPAGAFKQEERGKIRYTEAAKGSTLNVKIRIIGNNKFSIKIEGEGVKLGKSVRPEDVSLKIGNDGGRARARVK
jgi:hypothetical protein